MAMASVYKAVSTACGRTSAGIKPSRPHAEKGHRRVRLTYLAQHVLQLLVAELRRQVPGRASQLVVDARVGSGRDQQACTWDATPERCHVEGCTAWTDGASGRRRVTLGKSLRRAAAVRRCFTLRVNSIQDRALLQHQLLERAGPAVKAGVVQRPEQLVFMDEAETGRLAVRGSGISPTRLNRHGRDSFDRCDVALSNCQPGSGLKDQVRSTTQSVSAEGGLQSLVLCPQVQACPAPQKEDCI